MTETATTSPTLATARRKSPPSRSAADTTFRLPPHSVDAESGVLGCIFLLPIESMAYCLEKILAPEFFYDVRHQIIWEVLCEMAKSQEGVDIITVMQRLKDRQQLENVGGISYLATLPDTVPSAANLPLYVNIIREKYAARVTIQTCTEIAARIFENADEPVGEILAESTRELNDLNSKLAGGVKLTVKEAVHVAIVEIETRWQDANAGKSVLAGISTGFSDLDRITDGLRPKLMIVIGARPATGKTAISMNIAEHVAINLKLPVGVISMEMSTQELVTRMLCTRARVNIRRINDGFISERDLPKITSAAGAIANAPLHIDDTPSLTVPQLRGKLRWMVQQYGIKLAVIDYLQLLHGGGRFENRNTEITFISAQIKAIAKELDIPIIVLAQLNREIEKDKARKPRMSDLRDGGAIEQDADLIGLLYKPEADDDKAGGDQDSVDVNLFIAKQRGGDSGMDVRFHFRKTFTRFESAARISAEDVR